MICSACPGDKVADEREEGGPPRLMNPGKALSAHAACHTLVPDFLSRMAYVRKSSFLSTAATKMM